MNSELYDDSLYSKHQSMKSSGYLDDEYELSPAFRDVEQYHFRIEDDQEILELKELYKKSVPMNAGFSSPNFASSQFNTKMGDLLRSLDDASNQRIEVNFEEAETHGYYKLEADAYDEEKTLEAAYQHLQLNSLNKRMEGLTIDNEKVKEKIKMKAKEVKNGMKEEKEEQIKSELITKMKKMSIEDVDL